MKSIILLLVPLFFLISCGSNEKKYQLIEDISSRSLQKSNHALSQLSSTNYQAMREKLREENYGEQAAFWNNKATKLKTLTLDILQQIGGLNIRSKSSNDTLLILKRKYITDVILLDSNLAHIFKPDMDSFLVNYGITISSVFNSEKAKNDVLILESQFSEYFNNKFGMIIEDCTQFSAIVGQNTSHLREGEILEVTAGIGSYTVAAKPTFKINGQIIPPNAEKIAVYKLRVEGNGKKSIPVKIIFIGIDGQHKSKEFILDYYVDK